jgi:hypothetical protein
VSDKQQAGAPTDTQLAQKFHEVYERLAPQFGYETRKESAKPWADVPNNNKLLMIAVCGEIRREFAEVRQAGAGSDEEIARKHGLIVPNDLAIDEWVADPDAVAAIAEARRRDGERIAELERLHNEAMILVRQWGERANALAATVERVRGTLLELKPSLTGWERESIVTLLASLPPAQSKQRP